MINSKRQNITMLRRGIDCSPAHISAVLDWWAGCGLITKNRENKDVFIEMTDFGKEVYKIYDKFAELANKATQNREGGVNGNQENTQI
jgi:cold shock CspA family protein